MATDPAVYVALSKVFTDASTEAYKAYCTLTGSEDGNDNTGARVEEVDNHGYFIRQYETAKAMMKYAYDKLATISVELDNIAESILMQREAEHDGE